MQFDLLFNLISIIFLVVLKKITFINVGKLDKIKIDPKLHQIQLFLNLQQTSYRIDFKLRSSNNQLLFSFFNAIFNVF